MANAGPVNAATGRSRSVEAAGVVYVEFLLAFLPLFMLGLGVTQLILMYSADLVVSHAAYRATRAAAVVLDDVPSYYSDPSGQGAPRNELGSSNLGPSDLADTIRRISSATGARAPVLSRRATIELAAAIALVPLAPRSNRSVKEALATDLEQAAAHTLSHMTVSFPRGNRYGPGDPITVDLEYRFECAVPVAGPVVCPAGTYPLRASATLPNQAADYSYR